MSRYAVFPLLERVWELCENLLPCDASYVALAESLDCALLTADVRLSQVPGIRCPVTVIPRWSGGSPLRPTRRQPTPRRFEPAGTGRRPHPPKHARAAWTAGPDAGRTVGPSYQTVRSQTGPGKAASAPPPVGAAACRGASGPGPVPHGAFPSCPSGGLRHARSRWAPSVRATRPSVGRMPGPSSRPPTPSDRNGTAEGPAHSAGWARSREAHAGAAGGHRSAVGRRP